MRAVYYDRQGAADDVLVEGVLPNPEPSVGEVRVKVAISGVDSLDAETRSAASGIPMLYPRVVPHQDGAGTIDMVGPGVPASRIGERVWLFGAQTGTAFGTAAEYVVLPTRQAVKLPQNATFEQGACLGAAITAHRCLFADGDLRGRRVLVREGGGTVGIAAILLAKWAGAWVMAGADSEDETTALRIAGADSIVKRGDGDLISRIIMGAHGNLLDRIVRSDIPPAVQDDFACLAMGGTLSVFSSPKSREVLSIPIEKAFKGGNLIRFVSFAQIPSEFVDQAVHEITACVAAGAYWPTVGQTVPLGRVAEAHKALEEGMVTGSVLVDLRS